MAKPEARAQKKQEEKQGAGQQPSVSPNFSALAAEEAQKLLEKTFMDQKNKCWEEVIAILQEHNFKFDITTIIRSDGKISHQLDLTR